MSGTKGRDYRCELESRMAEISCHLARIEPQLEPLAVLEQRVAGIGERLRVLEFITGRN